MALTKPVTLIIEKVITNEVASASQPPLLSPIIMSQNPQDPHLPETPTKDNNLEQLDTSECIPILSPIFPSLSSSDIVTKNDTEKTFKDKSTSESDTNDVLEKNGVEEDADLMCIRLMLPTPVSRLRLQNLNDQLPNRPISVAVPSHVFVPVNTVSGTICGIPVHAQPEGATEYIEDSLRVMVVNSKGDKDVQVAICMDIAPEDQHTGSRNTQDENDYYSTNFEINEAESVKSAESLDTATLGNEVVQNAQDIPERNDAELLHQNLSNRQDFISPRYLNDKKLTRCYPVVVLMDVLADDKTCKMKRVDEEPNHDPVTQNATTLGETSSVCKDFEKYDEGYCESENELHEPMHCEDRDEETQNESMQSVSEKGGEVTYEEKQEVIQTREQNENETLELEQMGDRSVQEIDGLSDRNLQELRVTKPRKMEVNDILQESENCTSKQDARNNHVEKEDMPDSVEAKQDERPLKKYSKDHIRYLCENVIPQLAATRLRFKEIAKKWNTRNRNIEKPSKVPEMAAQDGKSVQKHNGYDKWAMENHDSNTILEKCLDVNNNAASGNVNVTNEYSGGIKKGVIEYHTMIKIATVEEDTATDMCEAEVVISQDKTPDGSETDSVKLSEDEALLRGCQPLEYASVPSGGKNLNQMPDDMVQMKKYYGNHSQSEYAETSQSTDAMIEQLMDSSTPNQNHAGNKVPKKRGRPKTASAPDQQPKRKRSSTKRKNEIAIGDASQSKPKTRKANIDINQETATHDAGQLKQKRKRAYRRRNQVQPTTGDHCQVEVPSSTKSLPSSEDSVLTALLEIDSSKSQSGKSEELLPRLHSDKGQHCRARQASYTSENLSEAPLLNQDLQRCGSAKSSAAQSTASDNQESSAHRRPTDTDGGCSGPPMSPVPWDHFLRFPTNRYPGIDSNRPPFLNNLRIPQRTRSHSPGSAASNCQVSSPVTTNLQASPPQFGFSCRHPFDPRFGFQFYREMEEFQKSRQAFLERFPDGRTPQPNFPSPRQPLPNSHTINKRQRQDQDANPVTSHEESGPVLSQVTSLESSSFLTDAQGPMAKKKRRNASVKAGNSTYNFKEKETSKNAQAEERDKGKRRRKTPRNVNSPMKPRPVASEQSNDSTDVSSLLPQENTWNYIQDLLPDSVGRKGADASQNALANRATNRPRSDMNITQGTEAGRTHDAMSRGEPCSEPKIFHGAQTSTTQDRNVLGALCKNSNPPQTLNHHPVIEIVPDDVVAQNISLQQSKGMTERFRQLQAHHESDVMKNLNIEITPVCLSSLDEPLSCESYKDPFDVSPMKPVNKTPPLARLPVDNQVLHPYPTPPDSSPNDPQLHSSHLQRLASFANLQDQRRPQKQSGPPGHQFPPNFHPYSNGHPYFGPPQNTVPFSGPPLNNAPFGRPPVNSAPNDVPPPNLQPFNRPPWRYDPVNGIPPNYVSTVQPPLNNVPCNQLPPGNVQRPPSRTNMAFDADTSPYPHHSTNPRFPPIDQRHPDPKPADQRLPFPANAYGANVADQRFAEHLYPDQRNQSSTKKRSRKRKQEHPHPPGPNPYASHPLPQPHQYGQLLQCMDSNMHPRNQHPRGQFPNPDPNLFHDRTKEPRMSDQMFQRMMQQRMMMEHHDGSPYMHPEHSSHQKMPRNMYPR